MKAVKEKVLAYITRKSTSELELLVFDHRDYPEAGTQVPAGTVDPGENQEEALLREIWEESGIKFRNVGKLLGRFEWFRADRNETHFRNVYWLEAPADLPNEWDFKVLGNDEDKGLWFRYFWVPLSEAQILAGEQGKYIHLIEVIS